MQSDKRTVTDFSHLCATELSPSKQQANFSLRLHTGVRVLLNALAQSYGRIQGAGELEEKERELRPETQ